MSSTPQFILFVTPPLEEQRLSGQRSSHTGGERRNSTPASTQRANPSRYSSHLMAPLAASTEEQGLVDIRGEAKRQEPGQYLTVPDGSSRRRRRNRGHNQSENKSQRLKSTGASTSRAAIPDPAPSWAPLNIQGHRRVDPKWELDLVNNFVHPVFGRSNGARGATDARYGEAKMDRTTPVQVESSATGGAMGAWYGEAMAAINQVATQGVKGRAVVEEVVGRKLRCGVGEGVNPAPRSFTREAEGDEEHSLFPTSAFHRISPSSATSPALKPSQRFVNESRIGVGHIATTKPGELRRVVKGFPPVAKGSSNFATMDNLEKPTNKFISIKGNENGKSSEFLAQLGVDEEIINISSVLLSFTSSPDREDQTIPDAAAAGREIAHRKSNRLSRLFEKLKTDGSIEGHEAVPINVPSDGSESEFWPKLKRATSQRSLKVSVQQKWNSMRGH